MTLAEAEHDKVPKILDAQSKSNIKGRSLNFGGGSALYDLKASGLRHSVGVLRDCELGQLYHKSTFTIAILAGLGARLGEYCMLSLHVGLND